MVLSLHQTGLRLKTKKLRKGNDIKGLERAILLKALLNIIGGKGAISNINYYYY